MKNEDIKLNTEQGGNDLSADVSSRLISKTILNDKQLQALYAEKTKIYSFATPIVILRENGEAATVIDETNHPYLAKINELIEYRIEQIKNFYS